MTTNNETTRITALSVRPAKKWLVIAPMLFLGLGGIIPLGNEPSFVSRMMGQMGKAELTIIARGDGTFDIKEYAKPDLWFAPDAVGEALETTAKRRFGKDVPLGNVNVLVKAEPHVNPATIRAAILGARARGFICFGFSDPRIGEIAQQVAATPVATMQATR